LSVGIVELMKHLAMTSLTLLFELPQVFEEAPISTQQGEPLLSVPAHTEVASQQVLPQHGPPSYEQHIPDAQV
jgi:hypothetical protein